MRTKRTRTKLFRPEKIAVVISPKKSNEKTVRRLILEKLKSGKVKEGWEVRRVIEKPLINGKAHACICTYSNPTERAEKFLKKHEGDLSRLAVKYLMEMEDGRL